MLPAALRTSGPAGSSPWTRAVNEYKVVMVWAADCGMEVNPSMSAATDHSGPIVLSMLALQA